MFEVETDVEACSPVCRHSEPEVIEPLLGRSFGSHGGAEVADLFATLAGPSRARILHQRAMAVGNPAR
ncbi:MAG: hypothetical protein ACYC65_15625 [Candidatus Limnocylindrales bacterium]